MEFHINVDLDQQVTISRKAVGNGKEVIERTTCDSNGTITREQWINVSDLSPSSIEISISINTNGYDVRKTAQEILKALTEEAVKESRRRAGP